MMSKVISIKTNIYFVSDLGYLFFDDGDKTIRLTRANFSQALIEQSTAETLVTSHPDFFEFVNNNDLAEERLTHAKITI